MRAWVKSALLMHLFMKAIKTYAKEMKGRKEKEGGGGTASAPRERHNYYLDLADELSRVCRKLAQ